MLLSRTALCAVQCFVLLSVSVFGQDSAPLSPGPAIPVVEGTPLSKKTATSESLAATSGPFLFSIGDPTDEEQLYLELINRSRADANAEVNRLLGLDDAYVQSALDNVNTNLLVSQFSTNSPVAPLSFNAKLMSAARAHTQYQFDNGIQSHYGPGTNTIVQRLQSVSYSYYWAAENVYSYAQNVQHGHAAFEIDWTGDTTNGGIQNPPGHRNNIHDARFVEIGVGIVDGTNKVGTNFMVGPQLVTEDFGNPYPQMTYITGVAYYDLNGNNFYDVGEGLSGVTVVVDGVDAYAVTVGSGGYSVPVTPGNTYTVRFKAAGVADTVKTVSVASTNNVKLDFKPTFVAPTVTSTPPVTYAGISNLYTLSAFAGATSYRSLIYNLQPAPFEGAEGPLTNVALTTFGNYAVISSTVKASGSNSFHLGHITDTNTDLAYPQLIQFVKPFYVTTGAAINFSSRLGISLGAASTNGRAGETARLEISIDDGATWTTIWSEPGGEQDHGPDNSEKSFSAKSASLANYVGKLVRLRFNYDVDTTVGWFELKDDKYGWYIDNISITGAQNAVNPITPTADANGQFQFVPPVVGDYIMQFGAVAGTRNFPMGPWSTTTAQAGPPVILPTNLSISGGVVSMSVQGSSASLALQSAPTLAGPWTNDTSATFSGPVNGQYSLNVPTNGTSRFYRVVAN